MTTPSSSGELEYEIPDIGDEVGGHLVKMVQKTKVLADPFDHFKRMSQMSGQVTQAAIVQTKPQDWLVMGKTLYLQSTGGERVQRLAQIVMSQPEYEREDFPDGTFAYTCKGLMASKLFACVIDVLGGRWSGDEFFDKFSSPKPENFRDLTQGEKLKWRLENRLPVDPTEVMKAAHTNWRIKGISTLCGLRGLTVDDLKQNGMDVGKIANIGFDAGGKGGKGGALGVPVTPPKFGPDEARGRPITDIKDEHLRFYIVAANKDLADGTKRQYHAKAQAWLDALMLEQDTRKQDRESKNAKPEPPADPDGHYEG